VLPPGDYHFTRYRVVVGTASKRALSGEREWWFGPFYDGWLDTIEARTTLHASSLLSIEANAELNRARLPQSDFDEDLFGVDLALKFSPDLTWSTLVQFDTESKSLGVNSPLRWTITPDSELFAVVDFDADRQTSSFAHDEYGATLKVQHAFRF
jgi:hypothetical protein